jgi:hypothetical protein
MEGRTQLKVTYEGKKIVFADLSRREASLIAAALAAQSQRAYDEIKRDALIPAQKRIVRRVGTDMEDLAAAILDVLEAE